MKTSRMLSTAAVGQIMIIAGALAAPLPGSGMAVEKRTDLVRVQAVQTPDAIEDRMARGLQHRSILQSTLQPPGSASPAEPPVPQARPLQTQEPQARALQAPEPAIATAPQDQPLPQDAAGEGLVTCEAAEQIVAEFGFSDIGSEDCSGDLYRFLAMRDGTAYAIGINATTGEIAEVSRQ